MKNMGEPLGVKCFDLKTIDVYILNPNFIIRHILLQDYFII